MLIDCSTSVAVILIRLEAKTCVSVHLNINRRMRHLFAIFRRLPWFKNLNTTRVVNVRCNMRGLRVYVCMNNCMCSYIYI